MPQRWPCTMAQPSKWPTLRCFTTMGQLFQRPNTKCRPKTCLTSREALMIGPTLEELQAGCNIITPWLITPLHHHTSIRSHMSHTAWATEQDIFKIDNPSRVFSTPAQETSIPPMFFRLWNGIVSKLFLRNFCLDVFWSHQLHCKVGTGRKGEGEALFTAAALFTALFFLNLFSLSSMHLLRLMEADPCRVLETPLIMCERNCHGLTCTILLKKLNFLLAAFALEQGGNGEGGSGQCRATN